MNAHKGGSMLDKAMALARAGRIAEADALFGKLLGKKPLRVKTLQTAIHFYNRYSRRARHAVPLVASLLKARPDAAQTHALAAETYTNCSRFPLAKSHADKAAALAPDDPDTLFIAAYAYLQAGDFAPALDLINHALETAPDHRQARLQKGRALLGLGDTDGAVSIGRALWQEKQDDMNAIGLFIDSAKLQSDDPILIHMRDTLLPAYRDIGGAPLAHLLKLLGKAHNDFGDYHAALDYFDQAKAAQPLQYDAKRYAGFVDAQCKEISRADYFGKGSDRDSPVLIVGMPRSGSTLLEQILTAHPQIASAGESPSLNVMVQDIGVRTHHGGDIIRAIKQIPAEAAQRFARRYLDETRQGDERLTIDKSLHNFELLGVFASMFPKARILHMMRDPMDTCVSCYMQNLSVWHRYTQSLDTLGHSYVQYRRLMDHWQTALPNPMMSVQYEDLVTDTEAQARAVIDFLRLEWDAACLDFQNNANRSLTLSARQVREPLYTTSMQRWRRYEPHLDPLKKRLARFYPDGLSSDEKGD
jgi:tetratricopeptide (TPR) repeat protein